MHTNRGVLLQLGLELDLLRARLISATADGAGGAEVDPMHRASAENLLHYVALRHHDIRQLQRQLARLGLSSLGQAEAGVLATVDAVRRAVASLAGRSAEEFAVGGLDLDEGRRRLDRNAAALLGPPRGGRHTRIMVTLPSEAATDAELVDRIVGAGAELVRINCAHDGPGLWAAMIENVRRAESAHDCKVTVTMDLGGPKLRTGPIVSAPEVLRIRPQRNALGQTVTPARVHLIGSDGPPALDASTVPVDDPQWLTERVVDERVLLRDARGSKRTLRVVDVRRDGVLAELADTAYLTPGTKLTPESGRPAAVGALPAAEQKVTVRTGDELVLVPSLEPADPAARPFRLGCSLPQVFRDARVGHRVFFDDGTIGGVVIAASHEELRVQITDAAPRGSRLGAAKGINLPDTTLDLPALTPEDVAHLPFVVEHADAVSLSFVREPADVEALQTRLAALGAADLGIVLKVETVSGFENLPEILLTALMSGRAECVMLNKGPFVDHAVALLADILGRMAEHQRKKSSLLRQLRAWR